MTEHSLKTYHCDKSHSFIGKTYYHRNNCVILHLTTLYTMYHIILFVPNYK
jgi:hypothetical protein